MAKYKLNVRPVDMYHKTIGGWLVHNDGDEKNSPTHKLLTNDEYENLLRVISCLERDCYEIKDAAAKEIKKAQNNADYEISQIQKKAETAIANEQNRAALEQKEKEYQIELNRTLLLISKERANAERKLKPKKEHTGYLIVSSQEKTLKYKDGNHMKEVVVWETTIQSPYTVDFTEKQARKQIHDDLFEDGGRWLIGKIGINATYGEDMAKLLKDEEYSMYNCKIGQHIRANYKAGYWEVIYTHTKPLGIVPKEMRAC